MSLWRKGLEFQNLLSLLCAGPFVFLCICGNCLFHWTVGTQFSMASVLLPLVLYLSLAWVGRRGWGKGHRRHGFPSPGLCPSGISQDGIQWHQLCVCF